MGYKLTQEADNDLIELYVYGFKQFNPKVRIHHHGSHLVIYHTQTDHILIVRILHDSMDIQRHMQNSE